MAPSKMWTDTVDKAVGDQRWNEHDGVIKAEIDRLNRALAATPGFVKVDEKLAKAMLWVESGGPDNPAWRARAFQIGNPGDPALRVLQAGAEGSHLIMDATLRADLKAGKINEPRVNIRAGLAYLFTRMAKFKTVSVRDAVDTKEHSYEVKGGDSLSSIAPKQGTTVDELKAMNPGAERMIRPKQILKFHKAKMTLTIEGWRPFTTAEVAKAYNGGGDPEYSAKLDYIITSVFPRL